MEIVGNTLYGAADGRRLKAYNLDTEEEVLNKQFPGPNGYLSSILSDSLGCLFISNPHQNKIYKYRISDDSVWVFAQNTPQNNELNLPNGMLLERENNRLIVIDDSQSYSKIHAISLSDSIVTNLTTIYYSSPDGIVKDRYGYYYIGGYSLPSILRMDADFANDPEEIFPGDHMIYPTYDPVDHSILITYYETHTWERIQLEIGTEDNATMAVNVNKLNNYPNPFNPETTISFTIEKPSLVEIEIYNIKGQCVDKLTDKSYDAGTHNLKWQATDTYGQSVSSGLYFSKMKIAGKTVCIRKMLLLK